MTQCRIDSGLRCPAVWAALLACLAVYLRVAANEPTEFPTAHSIRGVSEHLDRSLLATTREEWIELIDQRIAAYQQPIPGQVANPSSFDSTLVDRGRVAFSNSCTTCHNADRSLAKTKSYGGWLTTVKRMSGNEGADIRSTDVEPIAAYLSSLSESDFGAQDSPLSAGHAGMESLSLYATLSTLWRGSNGEADLENPGFFVDVWAGAEWQPTGPLRARVTACMSCHADRNSSRGFSLELVEASATLDLVSLACGCGDTKCDVHATLDATIMGGRFVVPFGAFSAMSHPGIYRTLTNPLMFNMGRRAGPIGPLQPVLPAPYADEGVDVHVGLPIGEFRATMDVYAVNGLQGTGPSLFNSSRSYTDNNRQPAVGGRATIGNHFFKLGGSVMSGNLAADGTPSINYKLVGGDATARYEDLLRFYVEYAIREDDSFFVAGDKNVVYGFVVETEARLTSSIGLLARYDTLEHRHSVFGDSSQERFTYGLNVSLPGGSWLAVDHEHWIFADASDVDVIGLRWTATF